MAEMRAGVLLILRRELRDPALADDLCNEAFRVLFERLAREPLEDPTRVAAYLAQTARNLAIAEQRKAARRRTSTGEEAAIDGFADPAEDAATTSLEARARAKAIRQVLEELPNYRDRQLLVRYYLHDEDKVELCREFRLTEEHFHRVLHRARQRFRTLLGRRYVERDLLGLLAV